VELISEGFDMAIRVGELEDSSLRARKLTETTKRMIGSPNSFQKFGRPQKIDDLNDHKLLQYSNQAKGNAWKVIALSGKKGQVRTAGWLTVNDGQSLLNAAVSGLGIACLPSVRFAEAKRQGLVEEAIPGLPVGILGICAVCPPGRFTQPKVRAFIDFPARRYMDKGPDIWCAQRNDRTLFIPPRRVLTGSRSKWPRPACFWRARLRSCWWPEGQDNPPRLP
jgi:DNA-binding transcriptional LysR family regulator